MQIDDCEHDLLFGVIEADGECIVFITCEKCDLLATGCGTVSHHWDGGYSVIDRQPRD